MRIITGSAKGTKLKTPKGLEVRPTGDRVKESLFNILAAHFPEALVLDLFAGTGNLGLEALSRGARHAVFVDISPSSLALVRDNANLTKLADRTELIKGDGLTALGRFAKAGRRFDLIFCDPPYNRGLGEGVLDLLDELPVLAEGGLAIVEHSNHEPIQKEFSHLARVRTERYGETLVSIFEYHGI